MLCVMRYVNTARADAYILPVLKHISANKINKNLLTLTKNMNAVSLQRQNLEYKENTKTCLD